MDASSKSERMCCYRCSRCQLEVYRQYIHYDRRSRPVCDPDCDGTKPGTCIWCEQVIVGRPMLMFDKKVHRECWQYCVAKFGYDEIIRRYTCEQDWEQFREREVGEDMVREMVEEFFEKFCTDLASDDEEEAKGTPTRSPNANGSASRRGGKREEEEEWGRAIRRVLHNKKHTSMPNIASNTEDLKAVTTAEDEGGEPIVGGGSDRTGNITEECDEVTPSDKVDSIKSTPRLHSAGERNEWLQAVQKSVCGGDTYFDRESWADEAYRNTLVRRHNQDRCDVTANDSTNSFAGQKSFVNDIIDEAVSVVMERNDEYVYKTKDGKLVTNYDKVWDRATRKRNDTLMTGEITIEQGENDEAKSRGDVSYYRNVLRSCRASLVDKLVDEAADNCLESSDEECTVGIDENYLRTFKETGSGSLERRVENVFSKTWEEARAFRAMYDRQATSCAQSKSCGAETGSRREADASEREGTFTTTSSEVFNAASCSVTAVGDDRNDGKEKTSNNKRRRRRKKQNDGGETSAAGTPSGHQLNPNVYESVSQERAFVETSGSDLVVLSRSDFDDIIDAETSTTSISDACVEHILTEERLDELFGNALVTSDDPVRLGRLINEFKGALANIQHNNANSTCRVCPKPSPSPVSASENGAQDSCRGEFDAVLTQLAAEVRELDNSILIFHKFARPDHFSETSVDGDLLSAPQGEVYGTGNVLIIFDYGEEALKSDPEAVYEYLTNIYHDRESPRCFLHRTSHDGLDSCCNMSEGSLSLCNGTDVTDTPSTRRYVTSEVSDEDTSLLISPQSFTSTGFEDMSSYDETLWANARGGKSSISASCLQGSSGYPSGDAFCTDVEMQAWTAMLNAGSSSSKSEEIASVMNREDAEENADDSGIADGSERHIRDDEKVAEVTCGDAGSSRNDAEDEPSYGDDDEDENDEDEMICDADGDKSSPSPTDAPPLHRLHSIKRINFDDSITSLKGAATATTTSCLTCDDPTVFLHKSVSESEAALYEMCACTFTEQPSDSSIIAGSATSGAGATAGDATSTWNEVRQIVTEVPPCTPLQHSASLGANDNRGPTDVYQIAIEITINKRPDQKRQELDRRRSSIDMMSFFQEPSTSTDGYKPDFEPKTQETVTNEDGDGEKMQTESLNNQEVEQISSNKVSVSASGSRNIVAAATATNNLADDRSGSGFSCNESSSKNTLRSRPSNELSTHSTSSQRKIKQDIDFHSSEKLNRIVDEVSNNDLITKESRSKLCKSLSEHGTSSNKPHMVNLSSTSSTKELDLEGQNDETVNRKNPSQFSMDVDLFAREKDSSLQELKSSDLRSPFEDMGSCTELFRTILAEGKCDLEESRERNDTSAQSSSEGKDERDTVVLKDTNENIARETSSNEKVLYGQEKNKDSFDVEAGSSAGGVVDPTSSSEVGVVVYPCEHDISRSGSKHGEVEIPRRQSHEEVGVESLAAGDEKIALERSGVDETEVVETLASGKTIESGRNVVRKTSSEEMKSKMLSGGDQSNVTDGDAGEDGSKSCEVSNENAKPSESVVGGSTTAQNVASEDKDVSPHSNVETISLGVPKAAGKPLTGEDSFMKLEKETEVANRRSLQNMDIDTSIDQYFDLKTLAEENIFLESSKVPRTVRTVLTSLKADLEPKTSQHTVDDIDASLKAEAGLGTSKEPQTDLNTSKELNAGLETSKKREAHLDTIKELGVDLDTSKELKADLDKSKELQADLDTSKELEADVETTIASIDYVDSPMEVEVISKKSDLNVFRETSEYDFDETSRRLEYDFDAETLAETELCCMSLCGDEDEFEQHPSKQHDSVLRASQRLSKKVLFNGGGASPKKLENRHGRYLSHRDVDNELLSRRNVARNTSSTTTTTTGSDRDAYKGNSTEEEVEVATLLSTTSEYGIDHQWSSQCGSDPHVTCGDTDVVSVLTMIRNKPSVKRVVSVCGEDKIEQVRDEILAAAPLAGGETIIQASPSDITRTNGIIDASEGGESSKEPVNKKDEIKARIEQNKKILSNANLNEICSLGEDENHEVKREVTASEVVPLPPPSGKKSKRKEKKEKNAGGRRNKGSPTCVIL